jgi:MFS family permease
MEMNENKINFSAIIKISNFRLLWIGQSMSLLGDQFYMIALPWLVLKLTNDPLALGTVLALSGVPRALFMLVGGAVTDRFSSRTIMLISDALRLILTAVLTVMILTDSIQLWTLYVMGLLFGIVGGFFTPASSAIMPIIVNPAELSLANSIYMATTQISEFIGPVLAGGLIALFAHGSAAGANTEVTGIAVAVAVDAASFLISVVTLLAMRVQEGESGTAASAPDILAAIRDGIQFVWDDPLLRLMFIVILGANFLFAGPIMVGIPVIANSRLVEGAAAYGIIIGGYAGGNLIGILLTSQIVGMLKKYMAQFFVGLIAAFGVAIAGLCLTTSTPITFAILFVLGIGNGVLSITAITFMQRKTPKEMMGRIMSLMMLASYGLVPVSQALSGALIKLSLQGVFFGAGIAMLLLAFWMGIQPKLHDFGTALLGEA